MLGISGASGAPYALRALQLMLAAGVEVHLAITPLGRRLLFEECDVRRLDASSLGAADHADLLRVHGDNDMGAMIASGSFVHDGMLILPCSSNTLGALAAGITTTLLQRAAAVALKERRRLIIAHRETPLTTIDLGNMEKLAIAGATIMPLSPGFYTMPATIADLVDFMVARVLDLMEVPHDLQVRWDPHATTKPGATLRA